MTITWHRPLLRLAVGMALLVAATVIAAALDDRTVLGANLWLKPLKFALSIGIYAATLSWLIGQLPRMRRAAHVAGTVSVAGLVVEMVIIVGAAALGDTSHFNVSTPLHAAAWSVMATSIVVVWVMSLVVAVGLFRTDLGSPARSLAIRAGVALSLVGMGLAFLMTSPTADQLADFQGVVGAHSVGLADGGPGLPLLGWSTIGGDLRIPHFVGMHALQVLPLALIGLELGSSRWARLASPGVRLSLVRVAVATYCATLAMLTWQALAGQSIVRPEGPILVGGVGVALAALAAASAVLVRAGREARDLLSVPR